MKKIFVHGIGAVSPAGWGVEPLSQALLENKPLATKSLARPGWEKTLHVRQVPPPLARPAFLAHARLRRTSPITQFGVAAGLEALGESASQFANGQLRLGIVQCVMSGCINYSRRFYDETLRDPATASPLVFPETVFNAPASHIAALLGTSAINYTLIGDPGTFLQGLALASNWLLNDHVDGCIVIGAEEIDWLSVDAFRRFQRSMILSDGAGAVFLRTEPAAKNSVQLVKITDAHPFLQKQSRQCAAQKMRFQLSGSCENAVLCDSTQLMPRLDAVELDAWKDWTGARLSPKAVLGEGLMAGAACQCVAAINAIQQKHFSSANVSVLGCNQQAIGAQFSA